ncbi:MAG TPA: hypothetical protein VGE18_03080 [Candidatus Paceibacterota bacterium]
MKKTLLTNLKYIAFGIVLATLASYAHASWGTPSNSYTGPSASFPNNNAPTVITSGSADQIKEGSLSLGGWFMAMADAQIDGQSFFTGALRGGNPTEQRGTVEFGADGAMAHVAISGGVANTVYTVQSAQLANPINAGVCADESGTLVLCDSTVTVIPPPPPPVATVETVVRLYVNGSMQVGTNVVIRNSDNANMYTIELPLGTNMGMSDVYQVDPGSYNITSSDISCLPGWSPVPLPGGATDFYLNPGDAYIIELNC